jgi:hypothetical protein
MVTSLLQPRELGCDAFFIYCFFAILVSIEILFCIKDGYNTCMLDPIL